MNLETFCSEYGLPRTRVRRTARTLAERALAQREDIPPEKWPDVDLSAHYLGPTERKGLRFEKPAGHERFRYEVTGPETLAGWLRTRYGKDLLTDRDLERLLDLAELLRSAAEWEGDWRLEERRTADSEGPSREEVARAAEELLRKAGRLG